MAVRIQPAKFAARFIGSHIQLERSSHRRIRIQILQFNGAHLIVFLLVMSIAAGTIAWLVFGPALIRRRRAAHLRRPVPADWALLLQHHMPLFERLPADLRHRILALAQVFISERPFVGCNGLQVTETMKVVIAAQAALLVVNRPGVPLRNFYDELRSVLIYPTPFIVQERHHHDGLVSERRTTLAGQAWEAHRIILSWEDIERRDRAGHNVVLHEFAHYMDMEDEVMDGAPALGSRAAYRQWSETLRREYDTLQADVAAQRPTLLDPYAASEPAEFFAGATEVFFERPQELAQRHAGLYEQLSAYYRLDPAAWPASGY